MWLESDLPHAYVKQAVKSWLQTSDDFFYARLEALIQWSDIRLNLKCLVSATHMPCIYLSQNKQMWGNPCTGLNRPWGFQEVEAPRFCDRQCMQVVRSAICTSCAPPPEIFMVLIFVRGWVSHWARVQLEGLCQWKIPMTPLGMEPMTFQLVVQYLNKLHHYMP